MISDTLQTVAFRFLQQHEGAHLQHDRHLLVSRCVSHLVEHCDMAPRDARDTAMQALGMLDARKCRACIDCSRTTSHTLFLTDQEGSQPHAITVAQLLDLLPSRALSSSHIAS